MEGKCNRFRNKESHFSLDPTAKVFMVDLFCVCSGSHGYTFVYEESKYCHSGDTQVL